MVAFASLMAGAIHLAAADAHLAESPFLAGLFLTAGVAQAGWAFLLQTRPSRMLLLGGVAANALFVVLWVASRTTGLPFEAHPWESEPVGIMDAAATAFEVLVVVGSRWLLVVRSTTEPMRAGTIRQPLPPLLKASFGVLAATVAATAWRPFLTVGHHHGDLTTHYSLSPPRRRRRDGDLAAGGPRCSVPVPASRPAVRKETA